MWVPRYLAAAVAPNGRFTVVLGERVYDDPFSAVISYDPRLSQPWSRVDVGREIMDVTYAPVGQGELAAASPRLWQRSNSNSGIWSPTGLQEQPSIRLAKYLRWPHSSSAANATQCL